MEPQIRKWSLTYEELGKKINLLEKRYDQQFKIVFQAIQELIVPSIKRKKVIGIKPDRR